MDADQRFHPVAYCIVSCEDESMYELILSGTRDATKERHPAFASKLAYGVSDSADAIGNAAVSLAPTYGWE